MNYRHRYYVYACDEFVPIERGEERQRRGRAASAQLAGQRRSEAPGVEPQCFSQMLVNPEFPSYDTIPERRNELFNRVILFFSAHNKKNLPQESISVMPSTSNIDGDREVCAAWAPELTHREEPGASAAPRCAHIRRLLG